MKQTPTFKLWSVLVQDPTPGWGLGADYLFLSVKKPTRALVLETVDWQEDLEVHPGDLAAEEFERKLDVSIVPANAKEANALFPDAERFRRLVILEGGK